MKEELSAVELNSRLLFGGKPPQDCTRQEVGVGLRQLRARCGGDEQVVALSSALPTWVLCAVAAAIEPAILRLEQEDQRGVHQLLCTPFPIDAGGCNCGVEIAVHEIEDRALVQVWCDPDQFDFLKFDNIVTPPVTPGQQVILCGDILPPIAVSLALSYGREAKSLWVSAVKENAEEICAISHCLECAPGDRMIHKIQRERTGENG